MIHNPMGDNQTLFENLLEIHTCILHLQVGSCYMSLFGLLKHIQVGLGHFHAGFCGSVASLRVKEITLKIDS